MPRHHYFLVLAAACLTATLLLSGCGKQEAKSLTFNADIKPIFDKYCVECHKQGGEGTAKSGLLLDSYAATMKGTRFGAVVVPGQALHSTLYLLVSGQADPSLRMPHNAAPLPDDAVNTLHNWIDQGAKE
jgi:hypothetical protein